MTNQKKPYLALSYKKNIVPLQGFWDFTQSTH